MDEKIDMTYNFLWDSEPTDEQLAVIMEEVAAEARREREKIAEQMIKNIERGYAHALAAQQIQQDNHCGKT
jgi:peptide deformylase